MDGSDDLCEVFIVCAYSAVPPEEGEVNGHFEAILRTAEEEHFQGGV